MKEEYNLASSCMKTGRKPLRLAFNLDIKSHRCLQSVISAPVKSNLMGEMQAEIHSPLRACCFLLGCTDRTCLFSEVVRNMQRNDRSRDDNQRDGVSDESSDSPEPGPVTCMEPFMVRRMSCRTVQLPPLAFRQAEQYYCDRKPEPDTVTVPPRPTTLPLRTPPLIAITSADTSRAVRIKLMELNSLREIQKDSKLAVKHPE
ncbi:cAMP-specific 3',5'-cyclic phosphodiesterase 4D [Collichthys lucidus]|uniref:cAMP-specific 3',5'-cyclic phosphodiesterase 4D n=1 Tax=Collichthys lucidus TaxID=240159 RepID=A0A4V6APZ2_COLLU|nr:cAMP-specific 3',5'-cyclic phosphodiesterase 4D [Collichthys lucidus]